jgi:formylglycine-generating enzyme required for sulfatase activity
MKKMLSLFATAAALLAAAPEEWRNPKDGMRFVWIPPGKFVMGCAPEERCAERTPLHEEVIAEGFWMGRTEVTVAQFRRFVKETGYRTSAERAGDRRTWLNPGFPQTGDHPVVNLSFEDAQAYVRWAGVDIPTDAEWEYAARAGSATRYFWGDTFEGAYAWYRENSEGGTRPAALKKPNAWGLYDVSGNAFEYTRSIGPCEPGAAVPRGGSWISCSDVSLRVSNPAPSFRCFPSSGILPWDDDRGFRCVRRSTLRRDVRR